jgi:glucosamine--fructose-6-phosphate aminotransferase (isomerizing)
VLVHLLEETIELEPDVLRALLQVFRQVEGLSAVAVIDAHSGQVAVAKNGSPLVLGWGADAVYVASDPIALLDHTKRVTFLEDGQAAALSPDGVRICDLRTGEPVEPVVRTAGWDARRTSLDGFEHFMIKEIHEQPRVLRELSDSCRQETADLATAIAAANDVHLIGCGTAFHACLSGRYVLAEQAGTNVAAVQASEMGLALPTLGPDSLVIALSQSGETIDVLESVRAARGRGARIAAVVNAEGSALHRFADLSVLLRCGPERCVLATKSYTAMLAVTQLVASALAGCQDQGACVLREGAQHIEAILMREATEGHIESTARQIADEQHLFVLGRHRNYPLALEAALKIKEASYMHAEGFPAGELKHGVIALVTYGTPCLILAPDRDYRREAVAAAAEVAARGAVTVGLSPRTEEEFAIVLPVSEGRAAMFEIAATSQLLAYELALLRGCDPDKPRNLAKSVTVK